MPVYTAQSSVIFKKEGSNKGLSTIYTTLPEANNQTLELFLKERLARGILQYTNSSISTIDLGIEPALCYYNLIELECAGSESSEFIVCFITEVDRGLDSFRIPLDDYVMRIQHAIKAVQDESVLVGVVKPLLENWYDECLLFIVDCVKILGKDIKYILHNAVSNGQISVETDNRQFEVELERLHASCTLSNLLDARHDAAQSNDSDTSGSLVDLEAEPKVKAKQDVDILLVAYQNSQLIFSSTECTAFCEDWAQALLEKYAYSVANNGDINPLCLKQINDRYKLKAIQDMNHLKRLVKQAEMDFYALFRCYDFLRKTSNSSVLLMHALHEEQTPELRAVIQILRNKLSS